MVHVILQLALTDFEIYVWNFYVLHYAAAQMQDACQSLFFLFWTPYGTHFLKTMDNAEVYHFLKANYELSSFHSTFIPANN